MNHPKVDINQDSKNSSHSHFYNSVDFPWCFNRTICRDLFILMLTLFPLFSVLTMMFWAFVFIRVLMAFLSWGYFVPDETWQSVEVAHKLGTVHVFTVKSTPVRFACTFYDHKFFLFKFTGNFFGSKYFYCK